MQTVFRFGQDAKLPAGLARCPKGTALWRVHGAPWSGEYYGPTVGAKGTHRYDMPERAADEPGTCYLAEGLGGAMLETVLREQAEALAPGERLTISRLALQATHRLSTPILLRDLVLVDLVYAPYSVYHVQQGALTADPRSPRGAGYAWTQDLARDLWQRTQTTADGILYASRFGALHLCVALWDQAADALDWTSARPRPLDDDRDEFYRICYNIGVLTVD
jgi:hypothetical protein